MTMVSNDRWTERILEQLKDMERSLDAIAHAIRDTPPDAAFAREGPPPGPDDTPERTQPGPDEV